MLGRGPSIPLLIRAGRRYTSRLRQACRFASPLRVAWWQSGHAADCKSAYAGSIPTQASMRSSTRFREVPEGPQQCGLFRVRPSVFVRGVPLEAKPKREQHCEYTGHCSERYSHRQVSPTHVSHPQAQRQGVPNRRFTRLGVGGAHRRREVLAIPKPPPCAHSPMILLPGTAPRCFAVPGFRPWHGPLERTCCSEGWKDR